MYGCRGDSTIVVGRRLLGELARVHHEDRVGDLVEDGQVVGDHDHALDEAAVAELDEQLGDGLLRRHVECRRDLVGDQERRVEDRREHHHDALLHPARELDRVAVEHVVGQADELRAAAGARAARCRRRRRGTRAARVAILPIRRVGFSALRAYCGMIETSLKRNAFIRLSSQIGQLRRRRARRCPPT